MVQIQTHATETRNHAAKIINYYTMICAFLIQGCLCLLSRQYTDICVSRFFKFQIIKGMRDNIPKLVCKNSETSINRGTPVGGVSLTSHTQHPRTGEIQQFILKVCTHPGSTRASLTDARVSTGDSKTVDESLTCPQKWPEHASTTQTSCRARRLVLSESGELGPFGLRVLPYRLICSDYRWSR